MPYRGPHGFITNPGRHMQWRRTRDPDTLESETRHVHKDTIEDHFINDPYIRVYENARVNQWTLTAVDLHAQYYAAPDWHPTPFFIGEVKRIGATEHATQRTAVEAEQQLLGYCQEAVNGERPLRFMWGITCVGPYVRGWVFRKETQGRLEGLHDGQTTTPDSQERAGDLRYYKNIGLDADADLIKQWYNMFHDNPPLPMMTEAAMQQGEGERERVGEIGEEGGPVNTEALAELQRLNAFELVNVFEYATPHGWVVQDHQGRRSFLSAWYAYGNRMYHLEHEVQAERSGNI